MYLLDRIKKYVNIPERQAICIQLYVLAVNKSHRVGKMINDRKSIIIVSPVSNIVTSCNIKPINKF